MSLMLTAYLMEKYGPRLGTDELAQVLGISVKTLGNKLYRGEVPVVTYRDQGKVWADCRDVAEYLDECRKRAKAEAV
jgi:predicted site-specific integrase-resolvase